MEKYLQKNQKNKKCTEQSRIGIFLNNKIIAEPCVNEKIAGNQIMIFVQDEQIFEKLINN